MFNVLVQPSEQPQTYKFSKEDVVNFRGQELAKGDYEALEQIAKQYFNNSAEEYFQNSRSKAIHIENKRVVKLKVQDADLKKVPEQIQKLTQVQYLDLGNNQISRIEHLEQLTQLQYLTLWGNRLSKIENLEQQKQLQTLELDYNQISRIENLEQLTQLQTLFLSNNHISKIENLEQQKQLLVLGLWHNHISKIENLEQLTQLRYLGLDYNQIHHIENLEQQTQLIELVLVQNQIKLIENLRQQKRLKTFYIGGNPIRKDDPGFAELINRGVEVDMNEEPKDILKVFNKSWEKKQVQYRFSKYDADITKEFNLKDPLLEASNAHKQECASSLVKTGFYETLQKAENWMSRHLKYLAFAGVAAIASIAMVKGCIDFKEYLAYKNAEESKLIQQDDKSWKDEGLRLCFYKGKKISADTTFQLESEIANHMFKVEILVGLTKAYKSELGNRGFTGYELLQIMRIIDNEHNARDLGIITEGEAVGAFDKIKKAKSDEEIKEIFQLDIEQ